MDDERLASELQRRSSGASPRPDWASRDLLPAVWREIDARPARVLTSRWSPLAGLATLVVALLVLVVAVPRLGPQPPSATSTPGEQPSVLTTAEFYALLTSDQLEFKTVLVSGRIGELGPVYGQPCGPDGRCMLGPLEGTPLEVVARHFYPTMEGPDATEIEQHGPPGSNPWRWYRSPKGPFDGTLLLSVDGFRNVEFLGLVHQSPSGITWSVADAAALDINSLGRDEVVLVDGWLGGISGATLSCAYSAGPIETSLPIRGCGGEWISSVPNPTTEPRLLVQPMAYPDFAPAPTQDATYEARRATYAVAPRLEGWCGGDPVPCWQWNVVARVDTVETQPIPSPTPQPSASPGPMSVEQFEAQLATGSLVGQIVLVNGSIGPDLRFGPMCGPVNGAQSRCYLGPLVGTDPPVEVWAAWTPTTEAVGTCCGSLWKWWHFPDGPPEGVLALLVTDTGQVELVGVARESEDGLTWSAADVSAIDPSTADPDEVLLVDAWLTGEKDLAVRCAYEPRLDGLLSRGGCSFPAWLTDDPNSQGLNVDDLVVQGRAYEDYSPTPAQFDADGKTSVPQRGVFAVAPRLYGDGCGQFPPCWGWSIVARIDATSPNRPTPEPSTAASPSGAECEHAGVIPELQPSVLLQPPTFTDETGLVASCATSDSRYESTWPVVMLENIDDPVDKALQISWVGTACETDATVTFERSGERFSVTVDKGTPNACPLVAVRRVRLDLTEPVDTGLIDLIVLPEESAAPPALRCEGPGLPILISDPTGLVVGCVPSPADIASLGPDLPAAANPDGDLRRLRLEWSTSGCATSATISVVPDSSPPLFLLSTPPSCILSDALHIDIELALSFPVDANAIDLRFDEPAPQPTPSPFPETFDCSETLSILMDRTGLVEACSAWTPEPGQSGVSQGPDASSVLVAWTYSYCRGAPFARFEHDGDRYVFDLGHLVTLPTVWPSCEPVTVTVGIAVRFKQPLDVGLIDVVN